MKKLSIMILATLAITFTGCRSNDSRKTFDGAWGNHAQAAWNNTVGAMRQAGIPVLDCRGMYTKFDDNYAGTIGRGDGRFPYRIWDDGQKYGGYAYPKRNDWSYAYVVREPNGFWNRDVGTHETGHVVEAHAKNQGGHPAYMNRFVPHWPTYRGSAYLLPTYATLTDEPDSPAICVLFIEDRDPTEPQLFTAEQYKQTAREMLATDLLSDPVYSERAAEILRR